jgi:hypothetical protein
VVLDIVEGLVPTDDRRQVDDGLRSDCHH